MPAIYATAPGKIILCGEHAVVYGKPAIALPVIQVRTKTTITARPVALPGDVYITALSIDLNSSLDQLDELHPLKKTITLVKEELHLDHLPACEIRITTTIPLGAGLGSSASVTVSLARALAGFLGHPLPDESINRIAYEVEQIHHGTPSGIDNTVVTYETPILFQKGSPIELLDILNGFTLVIADSGIASSTAAMVEGVKARWQQDKSYYDLLFEKITALTMRVYEELTKGDLARNGSWLTDNHRLLSEIGVSTPMLDQMVDAALNAGASGAKLSGGGGGGNVIAVVDPAKIDRVSTAFSASGAKNVIITRIPGRNDFNHE